jgi:hypothetical protein
MIIRHRSPSQKIYDLANRILKPEALNQGDQAALHPSATIAQALKQTLANIQATAIDRHSGKVDYRKLKNDPSYADYRQQTRALQTFDLHSLSSTADRLAFWINLYNVLVIDLIIHYGVRESIQEVRAWSNRAGYIVGGYFFSADDIEHGILRANAGHPALLSAQFPVYDPRREFILAEKDFRVHFALVCGAESCPPIQFYSPEHIQAQLELAAKSFLNGSAVQIFPPEKRVVLSKLLAWYGMDFGGNWWNALGRGKTAPVLRTIAPFIQDEAAREFLQTQAENIRVTYQAYSWRLNQA